jgi:YfiH family protein
MFYFFEEMKICSIKIHGLIKFRQLVHGVSPRLVTINEGKEVDLDMSPISDMWHCEKNWKKFVRSLYSSPVTLEEEPYFLKQVHGNKVYSVEEIDERGSLEGDAIVSNMPYKPIGVFTADCLPIIMYDFRLNAVGVIHAGRKGTSLCVLKKTLAKMTSEYGSDPKDIAVGFGPGVGGCCYEVGVECMEPFSSIFSDVGQVAFFKDDGKVMLNLKKANRLQALEAKILDENIFDCGFCTVCEYRRFFSYRRNRDTGRMMTLAMILPE